ncbi:hypothetical protein FPV67DRAFT_644672 [Lyophyllum atratum]|nr:hypothetical protein FPV67DRAFT_644672 [Lyophyllum atratum]
MFSVGTTSSRHSQGFPKSYAPQVPKGFSVRVFKGPALSSFPHAAPANFDHGYRAIPLAEPPRQSQNWYPSRPQTTSNSSSAPSDPQKSSSRSQITDNSNSPTNRQGAYESNSRTPTPSYSIYQNSRDTYVYEASLSSKSDVHSNSEYDDASTAAFTPSSTFSPAMSTDSITTLRGAATPDASMTDFRPPASFRNSIPSFPMHIPGLSQAQSAIRGIFRSQTPQDGQSARADNSYAPHASPARPTPLPGSADAGRSTTPIRLSATSSGSGDQPIPRDAYSTTSSAEHPTQPYARARSPMSESEHGDVDRVARANAEYNAASSASSSAYYSARDSAAFTSTSSGAPSRPGDATRQIYSSLPLRSSPEHQHAPVNGASSYTGDTSRQRSSLYHTTANNTSMGTGNNVQPDSSFQYAPSESEDTVTTQSSQFIPPLAEWVENRERRQPPVRRSSEEHSPPDIPQFRNEGPTASRYVPASRTMLPSGQPTTLSSAPSEPTAAARENDRPLPVPPPSMRSSQRERRSSISQPSVSSTPSLFYASHEGSGAPMRATNTRENEPHRRDSSEQQPTSYAPYPSRQPNLPPSREYAPTAETPNQRPPPPNVPPPPSRSLPPLRTSPEELNRLQSTHYAIPSQDHVTAPPLPPNNVGPAATRQPGSSPPQTVPLRASPEQMHRLSSSRYSLLQAPDHAPAPPTAGVASNYVTSSSTRRMSTSPPGRRNSIVMPTRGPPEPSFLQILCNRLHRVARRRMSATVLLAVSGVDMSPERPISTTDSMITILAIRMVQCRHPDQCIRYHQWLPRHRRDMLPQTKSLRYGPDITVTRTLSNLFLTSTHLRRHRCHQTRGPRAIIEGHHL